MEPHNFLEEEIHNVCCIIPLLEGNEMCHLGELIDYHHNIILLSRVLWEGYNEGYANIIPRP